MSPDHGHRVEAAGARGRRVADHQDAESRPPVLEAARAVTLARGRINGCSRRWSGAVAALWRRCGGERPATVPELAKVTFRRCGTP